jgi:predicted ATPase
MRRLYWLEQLLSDWALICPGLSVYTEPDGEFVRLKFSRAGVSGEVTASSGALCVLAILVMVHSAVKPTLLLIDDIEMHLDITAQPELFRALRDAAARNSNLQIVCTTHSPFILQHADSEQVRVLGLDPNGYTVARPLSDHPEFERWRSAMNAGELWANWGEEWIHESPPVSQERHG